ncbi:PP2C family protein-serine/threonine phosphatase [Streptomyces sp. NBC_01601]|uniref:PP2C family protein-serine/threonine phosphatase n=1 Tax=Streptomyces sp. NBC_01601 TaxID=2975892 RepID=UPI002E2CB194|nr:mucin-2 [Streptomyces sp. NBC_01601]
MRPYATAQLIGTRGNQCDAAAVFTNRRTGARAYVLLDGIGSTAEVREWTRAAARRLARTAARRGAEPGLRAVYDAYAAERGGYGPKAVAVVAVTRPGEPVEVAWCGDARAYLVANGTARKVTDDHNLRRVFGGRRNIVTSCLGSSKTDDEVKYRYGHAAIESVSHPAGNFRLLLASDGAYDPHEDARRDLANLLTGAPRDAARRFATDAVTQALAASSDPDDQHADNATCLVADLTG